MSSTDGIAICIVGAGSCYTPELVEGLLKQDPAELPVRELRLTDPNEERLGIMAGFTGRAIRHGGRPVQVKSDTRLAPMAEALTSS